MGVIWIPVSIFYLSGCSFERWVQSVSLRIADLLIYRLKLFIASLYLFVLLPKYFSAKNNSSFLMFAFLIYL